MRLADARRFRVAAFLALSFALGVYYGVVGSLPQTPLWADEVITGAAVIPAVFALVLLALPLRHRRGLLPVGVALAVLAAVTDVAGLDIAANFAKLGAATAIGFYFLGFFERLSWVVAVAAVIPFVDAISVARGPTNKIVTERPEIFDALSFAFPVPDAGSFNLGLTDLLFFAVFLAAAERFELRVRLTWLALTASFGITLAIAIAFDPFGLGGLPALPLLAVAFLLPNADIIWRELRDRAPR